MSLAHSPGIVTSGLVFAIDAANRKTYNGPPLQNLITGFSPSSGSGTGISWVASTETATIPGVGLTTYPTCEIFNNYSAVSTSCCPTTFGYGSTAVTSSTQYTYCILYRVDSGYTSSNFMYRYEYTSNGGTYVMEQGVHNDANRVHLGNGWYYAWGVFTTSATTTFLGGMAAFYYRYSAAYDKMRVAKIALIKGNWAGLHPNYWPAVNTTRANTSVLTDQISASTITATSLTYSATGSISLNGSTDKATVAVPSSYNTSTNSNSRSWDVIATPASTMSMAGIFGHVLGGGCTYFCNGGVAINGGKYAFCWYDNTAYQFLDSGVTATSGVTTHIVTTWDASDLKARIYINGVLKATSAATNLNYGGAANEGQIGFLSASGNLFNGTIGPLKYYLNKALSATDVMQNFNAIRGRYGI